MANKSVAIRIGTEGKAQVKNDFAEIGRAAEAANDAAAASSDRAAARATANLKRIAAEEEALARRKERATAKLNAVGMGQLPLFGGGLDSDAAAEAARRRQAAQDARDAIALDKTQEAQAQALRAAIDPLGAAQARYNAELAQTRALHAVGKLSAQELAQAEGLLKQRLDATAASHVLSARGSAQQRAGMQQLGYQLGDFTTQVSSGTSAVQAFAQQSNQAVIAAQLMAGENTKLGRVLSGPLGVGLGVVLPLVALLGSRLLEGGKSSADLTRELEKNAAEARKTKDAQDAFGRTVEGVTKAIEDNAAALAKLNKVQESAAEAALRTANANAKQALETRRATEATLVAALERAKYENSATFTAGLDPSAAQIIRGREQARIDALAGQLQKANQDVRDAERNVIEAQAGFTVERAGRSREDAINRDYDKRIDTARKLAVAQGKVGDELDRQVKAINLAREAELKRVRESERESRKSAEGAREIAEFGHPLPGGRLTSGYGPRKAPIKGASTNHLGVDYAAPLGTPVLAAMDGIVKFAAAVNGYGNQIELSHGAGTATRYGHLNGFNVRNGQEVRKGDVIGYVGSTGTSTNPHLHYEVLVNGKKVDPTKGRFAIDATQVAKQGDSAADRAQREAERARDEATRRERDWAQMSADADSRILDAKRALVTDAAEQAQLAKDQIRLESDKYAASLDAKVALGDLTQARRDELVISDAIAVALKEQRIDAEEAARQERAALDVKLAGIDDARDLLQLQEGFARTSAERRDIALRLLKLDEEEERDKLAAAAKSTDPAEAERARNRLGRLDEIYGLRKRGEIEDTARPIEKYVLKLRQSDGEINERVEQFAVDQLEDFQRGLSDAVNRKLGIKDPFLSQLMNLFIEQVVMRPIAEAMQRASAGGGAGGGFGGLISGIISGIGGFLGVGGGIGGNAIGTEHFGGGYTWLAENGPEIVHLPRGSKVTPAAETRRMLAGSNDNRPIVLQTFPLEGAVTTDELMRQMEQRSQAAAQQATQQGIAGLIDQNRRSHGRLLASGRD